MGLIRCAIMLAVCGLAAACGSGSDSGGTPSGGSSVGANSAPVISGTAAGSVVAGSAYSFAPQSTDAEGDSLSFSIQNKPAWATFNGSTGQLTGTPSATNIGTYASITIAVSDGHSVSALPSFSINVIASPSSTVTLRWIAPSLNTDGTNLNNLAGYRVYYGANEASMDHEIEISDPASTSYTISNLSSGRYYFGLTAYTMGGMESSLSNIGSKLIP